jgi:hypothetical protein
MEDLLTFDLEIATIREENPLLEYILQYYIANLSHDDTHDNVS